MSEHYGHTPGCMDPGQTGDAHTFLAFLQFGAFGALVILAVAAGALLIISRTQKED